MKEHFKSRLWIILLIFLLIPSLVRAEEFEEIIYKTEKAEVLKILNKDKLEDDDFATEVETVKLKVLSGDKKGEELILENTLSDNQAYNFILNPGDKVTITGEMVEGNLEEIYISDYYRLDGIKYLLLVFLILILIIGGKSGIRAILSLVFTFLAIIYILLPSLLKGKNPILISSLISIGITLVTILLITGFTKKSLSAIVSTSLGVIIAGIISVIVGKVSRLTGLSADDATMLMYIPQGIEFDFQELLFAGIILGSLGAVMDVGMSIASSITEIHANNPSLSKKELFLSGMTVGRDIMGTMVNTLILAYTGTALPLLLLFLAYDSTLIEVLNLDMISTEIVRSISGSIGLILTIPIASLVSSFLAKDTDVKE